MNTNLGARWVTRTQSREYVTRQIAEETLVVPVAGGVGDLDATFLDALESAGLIASISEAGSDR